jgi:D-alanine transaminase
MQADEAFMSAATFGLLPVVEIDGKTIGSGKPGPISQRLRELFFARVES